MGCCEMKGFLTFLILWIVGKRPGNGADISREIERRKGTRPSPGTVYPVLKSLKEKGLLVQEEDIYRLTREGRKELHEACRSFREIFYDYEEICECEER